MTCTSAFPLLCNQVELGWGWFWVTSFPHRFNRWDASRMTTLSQSLNSNALCLWICHTSWPGARTEGKIILHYLGRLKVITYAVSEWKVGESSQREDTAIVGFEDGRGAMSQRLSTPLQPGKGQKRKISNFIQELRMNRVMLTLVLEQGVLFWTSHFQNCKITINVHCFKLSSSWKYPICVTNGMSSWKLQLVDSCVVKPIFSINKCLNVYNFL